MRILIISFIIFCICFIIYHLSQWLWSVNQTRRKNAYPPNNRKPTMFDVRHLIVKGDKEMAIKVYCDIFKVGYRDGKKAVDDLEKSIKEKKKN